MGFFDFLKKKEVVTETPENNETLLEKCARAIDAEIAEEFRAEAKKIIELANDETRTEFLNYHINNSGNVCCLVLDKAKQDLIKKGKLESNKDDVFGKPFLM